MECATYTSAIHTQIVVILFSSIYFFHFPFSFSFVFVFCLFHYYYYYYFVFLSMFLFSNVITYFLFLSSIKFFTMFALTRRFCLVLSWDSSNTKINHSVWWQEEIIYQYLCEFNVHIVFSQLIIIWKKKNGKARNSDRE